jgi:hypothetical protein
MGVMDLLTQVEHFVSLGAGFGPIESDSRIDVVSPFTSESAFEWVRSV